MSDDERKTMRLSTCRHFRGIQHKACKAGVALLSVRDSSRKGPYRWPCLTYNGEAATTTCASYEPTTPEEIAAEDAVMAAAVVEFLGRRKAERCGHCGAESTFCVVGNCEYAYPCGHRQGQVG